MTFLCVFSMRKYKKKNGEKDKFLNIDQFTVNCGVSVDLAYKSTSKFWVRLDVTQDFKYCSTPIHRVNYIWCNVYHHKKWTCRQEFKSWTRLIAFHIAPILLGKV